MEELEGDKKCGEVFLTLKGETIYHCSLCEGKYNDIEFYGIHIVDKHAIDFLYDFKVIESQIDDMLPEIPDLIIEKGSDSEDLNECSFEEKKIYSNSPSPIPDIVLMNEDDYDKKCGVVYLNEKGIIIFNCILCSRKYEGIKEYNQHAVEEHFTSTEYVKEVTFEILWPNNIENEKKQKPLNSNQAKVNDENLINNTLVDKEENSKNTKRPIPMWKEKFDLINCPKTNRLLYKCKLCSTVIKDKSNIPHHIRRVHEKIKRYECTECHRMFHSKTEHKIHMRHHTGEKPYLCFNCGMTFISASELQRHHIKKHTKQIRDKVCPICSKTFTTRKNLSKHKTVHSEERPFKCDVCDAKFKVKSSLTLHNRVHEDKRMFKCTVCSASYNYKSILKSHMQSKHAIALE